MSNREITPAGVIFGTVIFIAFFVMFGWAAWKSEFIFRYGRIRGRLARVIGVIGLLGTTASVYYVIGFLLLGNQFPFVGVAGFLIGLVVVMLLIVKFLSLFMWHEK